MERRHPTVPSVKIADSLASYISYYKFQFKFNLKIEKGKFQYKIIVVYIQIYISYAF